MSRNQDSRSAAAGSGAGDGVFDGSMMQARPYSRGSRPGSEELVELRSAITRRDGAAFLHTAAGFVNEHRRHARRWDLAAIGRDLNGRVALYVGGSDEDAHEHRQIPATRECVPKAEVLTFPGHPLAQRSATSPPATA
jgi:hypothetical protein